MRSDHETSRSGWVVVAVGLCVVCAGGCGGAADEDAGRDADAFETEADAVVDADAEPAEDAGVEEGSETPVEIPLPPACGDGRVDAGEECDDGNRMNGDACDWLCRHGPGSYEYPPPDDDVPPVAPAGDPVALPVVLGGVQSFHADSSCRLAVGNDVFALAYTVEEPGLATCVVTFDASASLRGGPTCLEETWALPKFALAWDGAAFVLTRQRVEAAWGGPLRIGRFDDRAAAVGETQEVVGTAGTEAYSRLSAAWGHDRLVVFRRYPAWLSLLSIVPPSAMPVRRASFVPVGPGGDGLPNWVSIWPTPAGFVLGGFDELLYVDADLDLVGWTGTLSGHVAGVFGPTAALTATDERVWFVEPELVGEAGLAFLAHLLLAAIDREGDLVQPPRRILEAPVILDAGRSIALVHGPAGLLVVWSEAGAEPLSGWIVRAASFDAAGALRSAPFTVFELRTGVLAAADGDGYVVVGFAEHGGRDAEVLVRRIEAVPGGTP